MRSFLVLCALVSLTAARPDVSLGYKYPHPSAAAASSGVQHDTQQPLVPSGLYAPSVPSSPSITYPSLGNGYYSNVGYNQGLYHRTQYDHHHETPVVTKHFYIHSAPEEHADHLTRHITVGRPQKNYKVVFIKAPSSGVSNARITASYAPTEEKTVIYVLSKKPEEIQVDTISEPTPTEPSKPEVFFIKYKTPEEAAHAQQQIQAQYDALGGSSHVSNEGHAPVTSVVGVLSAKGSSPSHVHDPVGSSAVPSGVTVSNAYLPSSN